MMFVLCAIVSLERALNSQSGRYRMFLAISAPFGAGIGVSPAGAQQAPQGTPTGIRGTLNSTAGGTFLLQFFANPACDPSGYGEGQIYLGDKTVVTSNNCNAAFVALLSASVPVGYFIAATATDSANNTSEFSACIPVASVPALAIVPRTNHQADLAWTNTAADFILKQTGNLSPPIQWTTVTNTPVLTNDQLLVTLPITSTNRFFLLSFE